MDLKKYHSEVFEYLRDKVSQKEWLLRRADMHGLLEELQRIALQECTDRVFEAVDFANNYFGFGEHPAWIKVLDNWRGYNYDFPIDIGMVEFECDGVVYSHLTFYDGILGKKLIFECNISDLLEIINEHVLHDDDEEEIA